MSVVDFKKVTYIASGKAVLDNISFTVSEGNFVGIVGQNGSGKTTLIKTLLGLFKQASGEVKLFGVDPVRFKDWRKVSGLHESPPMEVLRHRRAGGATLGGTAADAGCGPDPVDGVW